jgi:hypothetical protein
MNGALMLQKQAELAWEIFKHNEWRPYYTLSFLERLF